jgi:DNA repair protein RecN (Recombination protein N)
MLEELRVNSFGGISGELFFSPNLNVIIGETGTGKSLLISSIKFLMGEKFPFVTEETFVEAVLKVDGEELFVRRDFKGGRSRYFLNGMRVPQRKIYEVLSPLFFVQSQREGINLLKPSYQLKILDRFSKTEGLLEEFRGVLKDYSSKLSELAELKEQERLRDREIDILKFQINEIEEVNLQIGEEEELLELREKLSKIEEIRKVRETSLFLLYEGEVSVLSLLSDVIREFDSLNMYGEISEKLSSVYYEVESIVSEIERKMNPPETELSLEEIEERLYRIEKLKKKYGSSYEEIYDFLNKSKEKLKRLENVSYEIENLERELEEIKEKLYQIGKKISIKRKEGSSLLKRYLEREFSELGLNSARFEIEFQDLKEPSPVGLETVRFLFSGNPSLPLSPISESISGGELSRFLLSILSIFSLPSSTMVFDEIDSGMSGKILKKVARKLKLISRNQQVIAVTHSPQVVAPADRVFKLERTENGKVEVNVLENSSLVEEISKMISGDVTEGSIRAVKDLLNSWEE